ncbi:amino acid permease [Ilyomonas limi]|uniref:Amino acid permease n=1 Tax=Ilyomonas limi TaxID=2575867 RepID=A0A4U3KVT6_9BACT|nr:amino acid permease [Ilyomonas limi]TKK65714.1 amino acid permease [Ilyomonas limi]
MPEQHLQKRISLLQATAINMTDMVGIGPFIVLSAVAVVMDGGWFLYAWIAGALLSFTDACIWSELGAAYPLAGGSYNFLKVGFGPKWGKLMSFLFVWQTMIQAPLVITSASLGFAKYFAFIVPLNVVESKMVSGGLVVLIMILLYRKIETIGKISVLLWIGVLLTIAIVIGAGVMYGNFLQPIERINEGADFSFAALAALGTASVSSVYSYLGYYNVCHLGGEIINPQKNIPRSMFISIAGIAVLYLLMNISVASVLPMEAIKKSDFVVSEFIHVLAGAGAATVVTVLILWVAFASVFSATLGYSRIPYAAAQDGAFFRIFAKLHPTKNFPYVSLLSLGCIAFIFSMLFDSVASVVKAILAMRILVQFIGQAIGLLLLHKKGRQHFPWRMPLFPIPVVLAILIWVGIFYSTGELMLYGLGVIAAGIIVYFIKAYLTKDWPFYDTQKKEAQIEQLLSDNP